MDRSEGPNFYNHATFVGVRIGKDVRKVLGLFTSVSNSFTEADAERSRVSAACVQLRAVDFPDGVKTDAVVVVDGVDWFLTCPAATRDGLVHLSVRCELPQRARGKFVAR